MADAPSRSAPGVSAAGTTAAGGIAACLGRRQFLQVAGLGGAAAGVSAVTGGCGAASSKPTGKPVRLGMMSNQTGSLAGFGEADSVVIANIRSALKDSIEINGTSYPLQIQLRDTGSQPQRAGQVASDLIDSKVDLLLAAGTPEMVNPVADVAEKAGMPCLSTTVPWQAYFFGRQKDPAKPQPFNWTYHFFWGLEDIVAVYSNMWQRAANNKVVAGVFAHDPDGDAWSSTQTGMPATLVKQGYSFVEDPRPDVGANSYQDLIDNFKARDAQILTGVIPPPDFATLWSELGTRRFRPQIATVGKALLFPAFIEVLKPSPVGLATEVWWHPTWAYKSSLTGQTCAQWAAEYTRQTHRQWTQPIGTVHALFEVAINLLKRVGVGDPQAIVDAIQQTSMDTIVGPLSWVSGRKTDLPQFARKNIAKSPMVGGQWVATRPGSQFPFDLQIVANPGHPEIPVARNVQPLSQT